MQLDGLRGVGDNFTDYWCFLLISHVILKYFQSNFYLNKLQLNVNKNMLELEVVKRIWHHREHQNLYLIIDYSTDNKIQNRHQQR